MNLMNIPLVSLLLFSIGVYGQPEYPAQKHASNKFIEYYNLSKYDSLFLMFSPEMKKAMPAEQLAIFCHKNKSQLGSVVNKQFIKNANGASVYKITFDNASMLFNMSLDNVGDISGFLLKLPSIERNSTLLKLPFHNTWTVIWGGDTKEQNYHISTPAQKNAFDLFIMGKDGKTYKTDGKKNEDYYAFGQKIIAPCEAEVVLVVDGVKDNIPGIMNPAFAFGNTVTLRTGANEFIYFAHFKQHSIRVKQGQKIKQGDVLGLCGNSGNSSQSHIHFHIQNTEDINIATGEKCHFNNILVNGNLKTDYSPVKGELISNP